MDFQSALDKTLRDKGIKGGQLASACGCSQAHISQLRNGGECTLAFQARVLDALDEFGAREYLISLWHDLDAPRAVTVREAISVLQLSDLTDHEAADLLAIAARHIRQSSRVPAVA